MRIVLDTNVLISALLFGGNPREILDRVIRGEIVLCLSESITSELAKVLQRSKFGFSHTIVNQIVTELSAISELVLPTKMIQEIKADETDNRVLECASEARADYIVSGDVHLLELKKFGSIQIVNPQKFLELHTK